MKLKGRFVKEELQVGLSAEVPLKYRDPTEKYALADQLVSSDFTPDWRYSRGTYEFEFDLTTDELLHTPSRDRCYLLISAMPDAALKEVEEELREIYEHYLTLAAADKQPRCLPEPKKVTATVVRRVEN